MVRFAEFRINNVLITTISFLPWRQIEVSSQGRNIPFLIVGLKIDLRTENSGFISEEEGYKLSQLLGWVSEIHHIYLSLSHTYSHNVYKLIIVCIFTCTPIFILLIAHMTHLYIIVQLTYMYSSKSVNIAVVTAVVVVVVVVAIDDAVSLSLHNWWYVFVLLLLLLMTCHIRATGYVECSSLAQIGLNQVFVEAVRSARAGKNARNSNPKQSKCVIS